MAETKSQEEMYKELNKYIDALPEKNGALISTLHVAQGIFGYLPVELQNHIAQKLELPASKVYGVVTFYSFFNTEPKGKFQINVCMGTACFVRGSGQILDKIKEEIKLEVGQTSEDGTFSLDSIRCVGACGLAPVVTVNGKVYGRVTPDDVKGIIEEQLVQGGLN